jgi:DNA-binding ferritin-like protein
MKLEILQHVLALLRVIHLSHWTSHWQVKGTAFYGDHQLLDRLYNSLPEEIDTLAEKMVAEFGADAVDIEDQLPRFIEVATPMKKGASPIQRALVYEELLQQELRKAYDALKSMEGLSLGLDDFIMSTANAHETNLYLMRQRLR